MVSGAKTFGNFSAVQVTKFKKDDAEASGKARALQKLQVENLCLESLWKAKFQRLGWSEKAAQMAVFNWATSTLNTYTAQARQFVRFAATQGCEPVQ